MKHYIKYTLLILALLCIVLTGCNSNNTSKTNTTKAKALSQVIGTENPLGFSTEDVLTIIRKNNLKLVEPESYDANMWTENPINDGRVYNDGGSFSYSTKQLVFNFEEGGTFASIAIISPDIKTSGDIVVGDSKEKILKTYPEAEYLEYAGTIVYFDGEKYLLFILDENDLLDIWIVRNDLGDYQ
jgi:hypothetical protein